MENGKKTLVHEKDGSVLLYVPGGEYLLGANDLGKACKPVHEVLLDAFWIGKYPVTNEQYTCFIQATGHQRPSFWMDERFNAPNQSVVGVTWHDAKAYCDWAGLDLPTEAEWEAAARGKYGGKRYPWGNLPPESGLANCRILFVFGYKLDPVGSHPRGVSPYGTLDQAGGVWEWCSDGFKEDAYVGREGQRNPFVSGEKNAERVIRGGSYREAHKYLRADFRYSYPPRMQTEALGFRVCMRRS